MISGCKLTTIILNARQIHKFNLTKAYRKLSIAPDDSKAKCCFLIFQT